MVLSEAIMHAAMSGDIRGVEVALATGDDINDRCGVNNFDLLRIACISGSMPNEEARAWMIRFLLESGVQSDIVHEFSSLCLRINADQVRVFVEHGGIDVNARDPSGIVPLAYAISNENWSLETCRALLRLGARVDIPVIMIGDEEGKTIVDFAQGKVRSRPDSPDRFRPVADLLVAVRDAGSWHRYCVEPSVKLFALRHLSLAGRAVAPPNLLRLFGAPRAPTGCASRTRSRRRLGSAVRGATRRDLRAHPGVLGRE